MRRPGSSETNTTHKKLNTKKHAYSPEYNYKKSRCNDNEANNYNHSTTAQQSRFKGRYNQHFANYRPRNFSEFSDFSVYLKETHLESTVLWEKESHRIKNITNRIPLDIPWQKSVILANMEDGIWQSKEASDIYYSHSYSSSCRVLDAVLCTCTCPAGKKQKSICSHMGALLLKQPDAVKRLQFLCILRRHNSSFCNSRQFAHTIFNDVQRLYNIPLNADNVLLLLEILCAYYTKYTVHQSLELKEPTNGKKYTETMKERFKIWEANLAAINKDSLLLLPTKIKRLYYILDYMGPSCTVAKYVMQLIGLARNEDFEVTYPEIFELQKIFIDENEDTVDTNDSQNKISEIDRDIDVEAQKVTQEFTQKEYQSSITEFFPEIQNYMKTIKCFVSMYISVNNDFHTPLNLFSLPLVAQYNPTENYDSCNDTLTQNLTNLYSCICDSYMLPEKCSVTQNEAVDRINHEVEVAPFGCDLKLWLKWPSNYQMFLGPFEAFSKHIRKSNKFIIAQVQIGVYVKLPSSNVPTTSGSLLDIWSNSLVFMMNHGKFCLQTYINNSIFEIDKENFLLTIKYGTYIPTILKPVYIHFLSEVTKRFFDQTKPDKSTTNKHLLPEHVVIEDPKSVDCIVKTELKQNEVTDSSVVHENLNKPSAVPTTNLFESIQDEFKSLSEGVSERLSRAIKQLSAQIYSNPCHVLMELLQNADDNHYPTSVEPIIIFVCCSTGLVVLNNELGFTEADIRAITDVGNSSKINNQNKTGKFGIGFKSVFGLTDKPHIFSNSYKFFLDANNKYCYPTELSENWAYYCPTIVQNCIKPLNFNPSTVFWLPYSKCKSSFVRRMSIDLVKSLPIESLLFSRKLKTIYLIDALSSVDNFVTVSITVLSKSMSNISYDSDVIDSMKLYTIRCDVLQNPENSILNSLNMDVQSYIVSDLTKNARVAFPVSSDNLEAICKMCYLYCFLPIRQFGFRFLLHSSDFNVTISREDLVDDTFDTTDHSKFIDNFVKIFGHLVSNINPSFWLLLPLPDDIIQSKYLRVLADAIKQKIFQSIKIEAAINLHVPIHQIILPPTTENQGIFNICRDIDFMCSKFPQPTIKYMISYEFLRSCGNYICKDRLGLTEIDLIDIYDRLLHLDRCRGKIETDDLIHANTHCLILFSILFDKSQANHVFIAQRVAELTLVPTICNNKIEFCKLNDEMLLFVPPNSHQNIQKALLSNCFRLIHLHPKLMELELVTLYIQHFKTLLSFYSIIILSEDNNNTTIFSLLQRSKDLHVIKELTKYVVQHSLDLKTNYFPLVLSDGSIKNGHDIPILLNIKNSIEIIKLLDNLESDSILVEFVPEYYEIFKPLSAEFYESIDSWNNWFSKHFITYSLYSPINLSYTVYKDLNNVYQIKNLALNNSSYSDKKTINPGLNFLKFLSTKLQISCSRFDHLYNGTPLNVNDYVCLPLLMAYKDDRTMNFTKTMLKGLINDFHDITEPVAHLAESCSKACEVQSFYNYQKCDVPWLPSNSSNQVAPRTIVVSDASITELLMNFPGMQNLPLLNFDLYNWLKNELTADLGVSIETLINCLVDSLNLKTEIFLNDFIDIIKAIADKETYLKALSLLPSVFNQSKRIDDSICTLKSSKWILVDDVAREFISPENVYIIEGDFKLVNYLSLKVLTQDLTQIKSLVLFCQTVLQMPEAPTIEMQVNDLTNLTENMPFDKACDRLKNIYSIYMYFKKQHNEVALQHIFESGTIRFNDVDFKIIPQLIMEDSKIYINWIRLEKSQRVFLCSSELSLSLFKSISRYLKNIACVHIPFGNDTLDLVDFFTRIYSIFRTTEFSACFDSLCTDKIDIIQDAQYTQKILKYTDYSQNLVSSILYTYIKQEYVKSSISYKKHQLFKSNAAALTIKCMLKGSNVCTSRSTTVLACHENETLKIILSSKAFSSIISCDENCPDILLNICRQLNPKIDRFVNIEIRQIFCSLLNSLLSLNIELFSDTKTKQFNKISESIIKAHKIQLANSSLLYPKLPDELQRIDSETSEFSTLSVCSEVSATPEKDYMSDQEFEISEKKESKSTQQIDENVLKKTSNTKETVTYDFEADEVPLINTHKIYQNLNDYSLNKSVGNDAEAFVASLLTQNLASSSVTVDWVNKINESGFPYDIVIQKAGELDVYIEVKASVESDKTFFEISRNEWLFAQTHGDNYEIYRVFNMGKPSIRILRIKNPYLQWRRKNAKMYFGF